MIPFAPRAPFIITQEMADRIHAENRLYDPGYIEVRNISDVVWLPRERPTHEPSAETWRELDVSALMAIKEREAAQYPLHEFARFTASLEPCDVEVTMHCADGIERCITRTKEPK